MRILWLLPVFFLLAGCASSERMNRMSGGVFQEYSAPKSYRIRSQKFQAKSRRLESGRTDRIGQVENTPVNVWPFWFSSDYYTAVLWPFIDWDDYGFAVRPFYNQEGDERAVLFPLSAWNPANGDGWVLLAAWNTTGFGFIPLCWQNRDKDSFWYYHTPLLIHREKTSPLTLRNRSQDSFTWFLLGYFKGEKRINRKFLAFPSYGKFTPSVKRKMGYMFDGTGVKVPSSQPELDQLFQDPEAVKKLPGSEKNSFGLVPLFHVTSSPEKTWWRALAYLIGGESSEKYWGWDVLGPFLAKYHDKAYDWHLQNHDRLFVSVPLMTYFADKILLRNTGKGKAVRQLVNYVSWREDPASFRRKIPKIDAELKKLDPAGKLPAAVTDDAIYRKWLEEFFRSPGFRALKLETKRCRQGGFLPLFWYETTEDPGSAEFFSFAGMTRYYSRGDRKLSFWSVPLLTYRSREKYLTGKKVRQEKAAFWIAPPLIWYSDMKSKFDPEHQTILPSTARRAGKSACAFRQDDFSALGLYYHGKMAYYAAKTGVNNKILEELRQNLPRLTREANGSVTRIRTLKKDISGLQAASERERELASKPGQNKIRLYEKLLDYERRKLALEKAEREYAKLRQKIAGLEKKAASIGFKFDVEGVRQGRAAAAESALEKLFAQYTEKRWQEDYGSGLFYRKEIFHNGDFHWRLLGILAGGEKNGNREHCHVLQFLYRYRRDGKKMEKIYFPFISIRENGADRRFSFLGRIYQKTVKNGRTGGYVFFIPF